MKRKLLVLLLKFTPGKSLIRKFLIAQYEKQKPSDPEHWIIRFSMLMILAEYKGPRKIILTGDSVVAAVKYFVESAIPDLQDTGFVGATPKSLHDNLEWMVRVFQPKQVRYEIGGNAVLSGQDDKTTIDQIIAVAQSIEGMCADAKWLGIVPVRDQAINQRTWAIMKTVERAGIRCDFGLRAALSDETGALRADLAAPDGVHEMPGAGPIWVKSVLESL